MSHDTPALSAQDQTEILKLLVDYAFSLDARDFTRVAAVFTDDAEIQSVFDEYLPEGEKFAGVTTGGAALAAGVDQAFQRLDATQHLLGATVFESTDDGVHARTQIVAHHHRGDAFYHTGGTYDDLLVRTPSGWRIARRALRISWTTGDPRLMLPS
ncbi:nuclear transport factor 2 family protein [Streptomyces sp. Inha503]|uniref:nuclear transport factor 2 family protein n=1 Tax=Streptomyces sp. Inha503 TaxID=3383314 RepID=UPI0039A03FA0